MQKPSQADSQVIPLKIPLPNILYRWFDVPIGHANRAEMILFRTVILDAFYDLAKQRSDARKWLFTTSDDLCEVADYADVTVDQIQSIARLIQTGQIKLPAWRIWRYTWSDVQ